MADSVTTQIIVDGRRDAVMKFTNVSDGSGESAVVKVTPANLSDGTTALTVAVEQIHYSTYGMAVDIYWGGASNVLMWSLPPSHSGRFDFRDFGGLVMPSNITTPTNNILFTTVAAGAGYFYSIVLCLRKKGIVV